MELDSEASPMKRASYGSQFVSPNESSATFVTTRLLPAFVTAKMKSAFCEKALKFTEQRNRPGLFGVIQFRTFVMNVPVSGALVKAVSESTQSSKATMMRPEARA